MSFNRFRARSRRDHGARIAAVATDPARAEIIEVGRRLFDRGLVAATEGNISVRTEDGLLVTAAGVSKGSLTPELVIKLDRDGHRPGTGPPISSESMMHFAIYRRRPDVKAIVHAHPPAGTAFAVAHVPLDQPILAEAVLVLGPVPVLPYATPSTIELADVVAEGMLSRNAALLANHGAVTVGDTLAKALHRMETLEHVARVTLMARMLGSARPLSAVDVERLLGLASTPYR